MPAAPDSAPGTEAIEGILTKIRNRIASGELPMGARISDCEIARELGVSPVPLRRALAQLQAEGLVEVDAESGTFVFDMTVQEIRQLCAARLALEAGALRASRTAASVRSLRAIVERAEDSLYAGDLLRCHELDAEFHEALVAASGNVYMVRCYRMITGRLRVLRQHLPFQRLGIAIAQHREIVDMLAADKPAIAVQALEGHVGQVEHYLAIADSARR
jgi:DNA-binding GntR family transcriptional regulator